MTVPREHPVQLSQPGRYFVPNALEFLGLCPAEGAGVVRFQFSAKPGTTLDFPVMAEALSLLERTLCHLRGVPPDEMISEIARLFRQGFFPPP
jgi:hypothetical protein